MARFIRSQTLTLLEKLNELDADEQADICESLHDHADELYRSCLARFGDDGEAPLTHAAPGDGHSLPVSGYREQTSLRQGRVSGFLAGVGAQP